MTDTSTNEPDRLARLIGRWTDGDDSLGRQLYDAVHQAIYPMCLRMLGNPDAAREAENETWRRLLDHLRRGRDRTGPAIIHATAYVREIARNVCNDAIRRAGDLRRETATDNLDLVETPAPAPDPAIADMTPPSPRTPRDRGLSAAFGYRSRTLMDDLAGLSPQELRVLALRVQGVPYGRIAEHLGDGLTAATAQRQGERAMHHLRGRVHVTLWSQEPLGSWTPVRCPVLSQLKAEAQQRLTTAGTITTTLYRDIGKHLDPDPNRSRTRGATPACAYCQPEIKRGETNYLWLLGTIPTLLALPQLPAAKLAAYPHPPAPPGHPAGAGRPGVPPGQRPARGRRLGLIGAGALVVLLVLAVCAVLVVPRLTGPRDPQTRAGAGGTTAVTPGRSGTVATASGVPEACTLVTPDEVARSLGGSAFNPCRGGPTPQPGLAPTQSNATFIRATAPAGLAPDQVAITVSLVGTTRLEDLAGTCRASIQITGTTGTVPNLGDENCFAVDGTAPTHGATVVVHRRDLMLTVQVAMQDVTRDGIVQLATLVTSRLP